MAVILVVDDELANRALISAYLAESGHTLVDSASGAEALELASRWPSPDLVLLDVLMPGMDGFEATRRLKAAAATFLPIILVTALTDQDSRRRGLLAGADDFLSKPVDPQELDLRVRNLLALRDKERALLERNVEHVELHRFRDEMGALLAHDLKNPLTAMLANLDYIGDTGVVTGDALEALQDARVAGRRIADLLLGFLDTHRIETGRLKLDCEMFDAAPWLESIVQTRRSLARQRSITIGSSIAVSSIFCDRVLLTRVLENILDNAMRYTPKGGVIQIQCGAPGRRGAHLRIGNSGPAIPAHVRERLFEKYGQAGGSGRTNFGLGLYFCRLVAEAHGGTIAAIETTELPTVFTIDLPGPAASAVEIGQADVEGGQAEGDSEPA